VLWKVQYRTDRIDADGEGRGRFAMKTREWHFREGKADWGDGPWVEEPDKMQWQDERTRLPCLIVRGPSGALCGYVGVSEGHPCFEKFYEYPEVKVHGGQPD